MYETGFTPFPILTTFRLKLRSIEPTDASDIFAHRSDNIVNAYIDDFRHRDIEETEAFIKRIQTEVAIGKTILWVITEKHSNRFIGTVCLWNISREHRKAETGYTLHSDFHNRGFMTEALATIIAFGFDCLNLKAIEAFTHIHNQGSIQVLLKNNFKLQGTVKKDNGSVRNFFILHNKT